MGGGGGSLRLEGTGSGGGGYGRKPPQVLPITRPSPPFPSPPSPAPQETPRGYQRPMSPRKKPPPHYSPPYPSPPPSPLPPPPSPKEETRGYPQKPQRPTPSPTPPPCNRHRTKQEADAIKALYDAGYTIFGGGAHDATGALNLIPDKASILAPIYKAFSYARMPYTVIKMLAGPNGKDALTAIVLNNMLEVYRSFQQFVDVGECGVRYAVWRLSSEEYCGWQQAGLPACASCQQQKANVVDPDLYRSTEARNCPFVIIQVRHTQATGHKLFWLRRGCTPLG